MKNDYKGRGPHPTRDKEVREGMYSCTTIAVIVVREFALLDMPPCMPLKSTYTNSCIGVPKLLDKSGVALPLWWCCRGYMHLNCIGEWCCAVFDLL